MAKQYSEINGKNKPLNINKHQDARDVVNSHQASERPDWGRIEDRLIWTVIQRVTVDDGAILFGYSRDGGAYAITIYGSGDPWKNYHHSDAAVSEFLIELAEAYNG